MANAIQMPKLSDTMTEGTIRKWLVKEGQKVSAGDPIAEVETDKATLEMEAYEAGTILKILVDDGGSAGVGGPIAVIGKPGEDWEQAAGPAAKVLSGPSAERPAPPTAAPRAVGGERAAPAAGGEGGKAAAVLMPKLSDTMAEGTIQKWLRAEGDRVKTGDPLAEVETDKATLEMEAYVGGTVLKILVADGGSAKVGQPIAVIGEPGADWRKVAAAAEGAKEAPHAAGEAPHERQAALPKIPEEQPGKGEKVIWRPSRPVGTDGFEPPSERHNEAAMHAMIAPVKYQPGIVAGEILGITYGFGGGLAQALKPAPRTDGARVRATPLARKLAEERGIDLTAVGGSGPGGRIVKSDVESARPSHLRAVPAAAPAGAAGPAPVPGPSPVPAPAERPTAPAAAGRTVPLSQMRKAIARAMSQAKREIPHFYLTLDVDMAAAVTLRAQAKASSVSVSYNDLVLKAVAVAAQEVPQVLGIFREEQGVVEIPAEVHVGFATALDDGLITPVIRDAGRLSLGEIARQVRELALKARDKKLKPEDYQGATITVSNLGMYDIEHFYAIVNPPQSSIVSVGKLREEPVVKDGQVVVGQRMRLGYSGDHRVVDGAVGARFLQAVKKALENPLKMLLG